MFVIALRYDTIVPCSNCSNTVFLYIEYLVFGRIYLGSCPSVRNSDARIPG